MNFDSLLSGTLKQFKDRSMKPSRILLFILLYHIFTNLVIGDCFLNVENCLTNFLVVKILFGWLQMVSFALLDDERLMRNG